MKNIVAIVAMAFLLASCAQWKEEFTLTKKTGNGAYNAGFYDGAVGCSVGYSGVMNYTAEGKRMKTGWFTGINSSACMFGLEMIDEKTFLACGNRGHVVLSTDGGEHWGRKADFGGQEPGQCRYASFAGRDAGWIASTLKIGETLDLGKTWTEIPYDQSNGVLLSVCCVGAGKGYAFTHTGAVVKTEDAGKTWVNVGKVVDPSKVPLRSGMSRLQQIAQLRVKGDTAILAFVNDVNGKATLHVYSSADGCKTWVKDFEKPHVLSTVFVSPDMGRITTLNFDKTVTVFKSRAAKRG